MAIIFNPAALITTDTLLFLFALLFIQQVRTVYKRILEFAKRILGK